jgi:NAD(P)-dependent dehydrogenase (short-subunit alcohol dehydrogenase family)
MHFHRRDEAIVSWSPVVEDIHRLTPARELETNVPPRSCRNLLISYYDKRMGTPEEIANAIVFIGSDKASYIVGASLAVDGGMTAG